MDCAFCKRTMVGCASIKCSRCASQFHLECVSSEHLVPNTNSWLCCNCGTNKDLSLPAVNAVRT